MENPELFILIINVTIISIQYFIVFPIFAKNDINKIAINDLIASIVSLVIAASFFMKQGMNLILFLPL